MKERGKFVVVTGGVGCGKTTQYEKIKKELGDFGWMYTREPGGTPYGERLRYIVQDEKNKDVDIHPYAALLTYNASRANLIRGVVIPKLHEGVNFLQDRYWYATYSYQGAEGVSKPIIWLTSMIATNFLKPDLVIHYDLDPKIGMARKNGRVDSDRYDEMEIEFHNRVRRNYLELRKIYPGIWRTIDASKSIDEVFEETKKILGKFGII